MATTTTTNTTGDGQCDDVKCAVDAPPNEGASETVRIGSHVSSTEAGADAGADAGAEAVASPVRQYTLALVCEDDMPVLTHEMAKSTMIAIRDHLFNFGICAEKVCVLTAPLHEMPTTMLAHMLSRYAHMPCIILHDDPAQVLRGATHVLRLRYGVQDPDAGSRWGALIDASTVATVLELRLPEFPVNYNMESVCSVQ